MTYGEAPALVACEVLTEGGVVWRPCRRQDLRAGQTFRLWVDGAWVRYRATGDAAVGPSGDVVVEVEPVPETDVERAARTETYWWPPAHSGLPRSARGSRR